MSAADLLAVLVSRHLKYDWDNPKTTDNNDHLIFSKGHASPLLYSIYKAVGVVSDQELMNDYRRFGSRLEGHPTPVLPWVDVATGSLGQGLPDAVGIALAGKYLDKLPYRAWVLCGDSEMAEGSIWEALDKAAYYKLSNLVAMIDINRLGQRGPTELEWDLDKYAKRAEGFGARVLEIDGHDLQQIDEAFSNAIDPDEGRPTVILARTIKGRGFSEVENLNGWHGKPFPEDMAKRAIDELGGERNLFVRGPKPEPLNTTPMSTTPMNTAPMNTAPMNTTASHPLETEPKDAPEYDLGSTVATRQAYGDALLALGSRRPDVVALDGEVSNSTHADEFAKAYPERYFEMFIAEQQLVASATGLSVRRYNPFASTFAAFLTRAHDFIRMAAISQVNLRLIGSHAGVEIGADGPSQMALEDLAMMQAVQGSTVLYPSDGTSTVSLVEEMASRRGIVYMRTTRGAYPVLYPAGEKFPIGGSKVLRSDPNDQVTLVGAGVTVHECLAAWESLAKDGIHVRIIDLYSVKPVDVDTLTDAVAHTQGRILVAEDHHPQGGIGSAVLAALASAAASPIVVQAVSPTASPLRFVHLAVRSLPGSGTPQELLAAAGIDAHHIEEAVRTLLSQSKDGARAL